MRQGIGRLFSSILAAFALAAKPESHFRDDYDPDRKGSKARGGKGRKNSNPTRFHGYRWPFETRQAAR